MKRRRRAPILHKFYRRYLLEEDSAVFVRRVSEHYTVATLERLLRAPSRVSRRAAVLALGFLGDYSSNAALGRALNDADRGVRMLAQNGIQQLWRRAGDVRQRQQLTVVGRLMGAHQYDEVVELTSRMIDEAPWLAECWNQRAIAYFHLQQFERAIRDCHQCLEINPYHFGAASGMGQCFLELGDRRAALECFRRALRLNPDLEAVRVQAARLERLLKDR